MQRIRIYRSLTIPNKKDKKDWDKGISNLIENEIYLVEEYEDYNYKILAQYKGIADNGPIFDMGNGEQINESCLTCIIGPVDKSEIFRSADGLFISIDEIAKMVKERILK